MSGGATHFSTAERQQGWKEILLRLFLDGAHGTNLHGRTGILQQGQQVRSDSPGASEQQGTDALHAYPGIGIAAAGDNPILVAWLLGILSRQQPTAQTAMARTIGLRSELNASNEGRED